MATKAAATKAKKQKPSPDKSPVETGGAVPDKPEADEEKRRESRKDLVIKLYDLITMTPPDESGEIEGTPFFVSGVERMMFVLKSLSERDSGPSVRISGNVIRFLTSDEKSPSDVAGVSVEKLLWLAKMGKRFKE